MTFKSEIATAAEFKKAMARDPGLVFIYGVLDGRQVAITVASVMETTNEAVIYGPKKNWRAYIRNADGMRFTARPKFETYFTLPFAKKKKAASFPLRKPTAPTIRSKPPRAICSGRPTRTNCWKLRHIFARGETGRRPRKMAGALQQAP